MIPGSCRHARKSLALVFCLALSALTQTPVDPPRRDGQRFPGSGRGPGGMGDVPEDVKTDTRRLDSLDAFTNGATVDTESAGMRGPRRNISLKSFVEKRRAYLLNHPAVQQTRD